MEIAYSLRTLWRLRIWVAVAMAVALLGATALTQSVSLFPPSVSSKQGIEGGAASTSLLVDSPRSAIGNLNSPLDPLAARAALIALLTKSDPVQQQVLREMGISPRNLTTTVTIPNPYDPNLPPTLSSGARASSLIGETAPYQLSAQPALATPIVDIYAQAPTGKAAIALVKATSSAVRKYLTHLQKENAIPKLSRVELRTLGEATGGDVNAGAGPLMFLLALVGLFLAGCIAILGASRIAQDLQIERDLEDVQGVELPQDPIGVYDHDATSPLRSSEDPTRPARPASSRFE